MLFYTPLKRHHPLLQVFLDQNGRLMVLDAAKH